MFCLFVDFIFYNIIVTSGFTSLRISFCIFIQLKTCSHFQIDFMKFLVSFYCFILLCRSIIINASHLSRTSIDYVCCLQCGKSFS